MEGIGIQMKMLRAHELVEWIEKDENKYIGVNRIVKDVKSKT